MVGIRISEINERVKVPNLGSAPYVLVSNIVLLGSSWPGLPDCRVDWVEAFPVVSQSFVIAEILAEIVLPTRSSYSKA